jgi:hypothetical protein
MTGAGPRSKEGVHAETEDGWREWWVYVCRSKEMDSNSSDELFLGQRARREGSRRPATKRRAAKKENETSKQQHSCQWPGIKERKAERVEERAWKSHGGRAGDRDGRWRSIKSRGASATGGVSKDERGAKLKRQGRGVGGGRTTGLSADQTVSKTRER